MPGFDRSGPSGAGPMTERGLGQCSGNVTGRGLGRGYGPGMGCGRGLRAGYGGAGNGAGFAGGRSVGPGRGLGWFSAGYGGAGYGSAGYNGAGYVPPTAGDAGADIRDALKARAAALRAELERTEAMLSDSGEPSSGKDSVE